MIDRRFERRTSQPEFFCQTQKQHDAGRMNRPSCFRILFDLQLGHRLQHLAANLTFKLFQFRDPKSIVVRSPIPSNQLGRIAAPGG